MNDRMQYRRLTDEASVIVGENGESRAFSLSLDNDRNIRGLRKTILILLLIQWSLCTVLLVIDIRLLMQDKDENYRQGIRSFPPILLSFISYTCGLGVVYRYYHLGIYSFAWLGFLSYLSLCAEAFISIVYIIGHLSDDPYIGIHILSAFSIAIISLIITILLVITLKLTFRLLHFIKIFKREVLGQL